MNEIIENTFIFIDNLEKSDLIKKLTECKEILLKNNKVLNLIKEYNNLEDTNILLSLKKELYQNHTYQRYMELYDELYMLVKSINKKYSSYLGENVCQKNT